MHISICNGERSAGSETRRWRKSSGRFIPLTAPAPINEPITNDASPTSQRRTMPSYPEARQISERASVRSLVIFFSCFSRSNFVSSELLE